MKGYLLRTLWGIPVIAWYYVAWLALAQVADGVGRIERGSVFNRPLPGHISYVPYQFIAGISFLALIIFFVWGFFLDPWWTPLAAIGIHLATTVVLRPLYHPDFSVAKVFIGFVVAVIALIVFFVTQ